MSHDDFLQSLRALVGAAHVLGGEQAAPFLVDWRGHFRGAARAVVVKSRGHFRGGPHHDAHRLAGVPMQCRFQRRLDLSL